MGIQHIFAAALVAAGIATLSSGALAAPLNSAAARVFTDTAAPLVEQVQYRRYRRHRMDAATRERIMNNYLSRMRVRQDPDGMILLPGISTGWGGITTITGAPRSRFSNPQRLGVPRHGSGGRLTGNVPGMRRH
jgi:hypothetical protein